MRERYRIYQRNGGIFYAKDRKAGQAFSLVKTIGAKRRISWQLRTKRPNSSR